MPADRRNEYPLHHSVWEKLLLGILMVICAFGVNPLFSVADYCCRIVDKIPWLRKIKVFVQIIARYSPKELEKLLLLSAVRYLVFSAQYLILLYALGVYICVVAGLFDDQCDLPCDGRGPHHRHRRDRASRAASAFIFSGC